MSILLSIKKNLDSSFFENIDDDVHRIHKYIEKIKGNYFYRGTIELGILSNKYKINISAY